MNGLWIDLQGGKSVLRGEINEQKPVSDYQLKVFNVFDLKELVASWNKKRPDQTWARSPATWYKEDMFIKYGHTPININLSFDSGRVVKSSTTPEAVQKTILKNDSSKRGTFHTDLTIQKTDTLSSTFDQSSALTAEFKIGLEIVIVTVETSFRYTNTWGESHTTTKSKTLGSTAGVSIELDPGQAVEVSLIATRSLKTIEIVYNAWLSDMFTIAYNDKYDYNNNNNKHNIWFIPIPNFTKKITEKIEIDAYGESKVVIRDMATNNELHTFQLDSGDTFGKNESSQSLSFSAVNDPKGFGDTRLD